MIFDQSLSSAILTIYKSFGIAKLFWLWLFLVLLSQAVKSYLHVDHTSTAYRALVRTMDMLIVASTMYAMPAAHETNSSRGGEHVFATYGTVTIG